MSESPGKGWRRNEGRMPGKKGRRCSVQLANGSIAGVNPVSAACPAGWLVETTRWSLTDEPFDVEWYRLL